MNTKELYQAIATTDDKRKFEHISYDYSTNNHLPEDWWAFLPFGNWQNFPQLPAVSPLEEKILAAIQFAVNRPSPGICQIDIAGLNYASANIFDDAHCQPLTIAAKLAAYIATLPKDTTVIIRYLIGCQTVGLEFDPKKDPLIVALFKHINRENAYFYWGNFSPTFVLNHHAPTLPAHATGVGGISNMIQLIWDWLKEEARKIGMAFDHILAYEKHLLELLYHYVQKIALPLSSWNHSKIFAINGCSLVTGGVNYWEGYQSDPSGSLVADMDMLIHGDAAISSHLFLNYLWDYLEKKPGTDLNSWSASAPLNGIDAYKLLKKNNAGNIPAFHQFEKNSGNSAALTVARVGNWPFDNGYPIQIFDAIRDLLINAVAAVVDKISPQDYRPVVWLTEMLSDGNVAFRTKLQEFNINTSCWSSRYARNYAVQHAQHEINFSQQSPICPFAMDNGIYREIISKFNVALGTHWDGYIWPLDLMVAMSYALATMHNSSVQDAGIRMVYSKLGGGWGDLCHGPIFQERLAKVLQALTKIHDTDLNIDSLSLVNRLVDYRRIDGAKIPRLEGNHAKLMIIDNMLCYIGSDNVYPSFNQEFGIWIDDANAINHINENYWSGLLQHSLRDANK